MKRTLIIATLGVMAALQASASVITFDDLSESSGYGALVPNGYAGLTWQNFYFVNGNNNYYNPSGYKVGVVSADNVVFNGWGDPALVSDTKFDLISAYLTSAWYDDNQVTVIGYLEGVEKYNNTYSLSTTEAKLINFNYIGVDSIKFSSSHMQFAMDNMDITAVPEPSNYVAGVSALSMLVLAWRKRK